MDCGPAFVSAKVLLIYFTIEARHTFFFSMQNVWFSTGMYSITMLSKMCSFQSINEILSNESTYQIYPHNKKLARFNRTDCIYFDSA